MEKNFTKQVINDSLEEIKSGHIQGAVVVKTLIQIVEVGIALTIITFLGSALLKIISLGVFNEYNGILNYFSYLFGYDISIAFAVILCALLVVMVGRWAMSWASNNGGHTPNNNGN